MKDDPKPKLTMADIQAILDAAKYHEDLLKELEQAYQQCDLNQTLIIIRQLLGLEKESIQ